MEKRVEEAEVDKKEFESKLHCSAQAKNNNNRANEGRHDCLDRSLLLLSFTTI